MNMESYTVAELSDAIKKSIQSEFKGKVITVTGEISNTKQSGRHTYLTLKDDFSSISVAFWGTSLNNPNGDHVEITGKIDYYAKSGYVNLIGTKIKSIGIGALHAEYEKLKKEYEGKGYFDNKRSPPENIKSIGIVTSESGAALHDFLYALENKGFSGDVYIYDCIVQGTRCPASVAAGIKFFNNPFYPPSKYKICQGNINPQKDESENSNDCRDGDSNDDSDDDAVNINNIGKKSKIRKCSDTNSDISEVEVDLIIITRGGGSFEDLMGFSHPKVLEAIYNSKKYTVSAVGHEVDSMLSDYVANHREPTPSFAGDFVCKVGDTRRKKLEQIESKVKNTKHEILQTLYRYKNFINKLDMTLEDPKIAIELKINEIYKKALGHINNKFCNYSEKLSNIREKIESNDVTKILSHGFVVVTNKNGDILTDISDMVNNTVFIRNSDGKYKVTIQEDIPNRSNQNSQKDKKLGKNNNKK